MQIFAGRNKTAEGFRTEPEQYGHHVRQQVGAQCQKNHHCTISVQSEGVKEHGGMDTGNPHLWNPGKAPCVRIKPVAKACWLGQDVKNSSKFQEYLQQQNFNTILIMRM